MPWLDAGQSSRCCVAVAAPSLWGWCRGSCRGLTQAAFPLLCRRGRAVALRLAPQPVPWFVAGQHSRCCVAVAASLCDWCRGSCHLDAVQPSRCCVAVAAPSLSLWGWCHGSCRGLMQAAFPLLCRRGRAVVLRLAPQPVPWFVAGSIPAAASQPRLLEFIVPRLAAFKIYGF